MANTNIDSGIAALSICEALLLALNDANILPESEIMGVLKDAAVSHEKADGSDFEIKTDSDMASLINQIIAGGNSVRKPSDRSNNNLTSFFRKWSKLSR